MELNCGLAYGIRTGGDADQGERATYSEALICRDCSSQRPKCYPVFWLIIERQLRIFKDKLIVDNSGQLLELLHKVHFGDQN